MAMAKYLSAKAIAGGPLETQQPVHLTGRPSAPSRDDEDGYVAVEKRRDSSRLDVNFNHTVSALVREDGRARRDAVARKDVDMNEIIWYV
jgi:hypothetical protein